jgi:parallel beta-helix repeat protein
MCLLIISGFLGFITFESNDVSASTIYVGSGFGNHTTSIFDAIVNFASPGDTVFVYSGVYNEAIWINKTINLIGEDMQTTIIDGGGGIVVMISSTNWVNITGLTITNGNYGIWISNASFLNIQGNEIYNNTQHGIESNNSLNNIFINNKVHDNSYNGFYFRGCPYYNNKIIGNVIYNNQKGIWLKDESSVDMHTFWNNSIINNTVFNNTSDGIFLDHGQNNFIIDNIVHHNGLGSINPLGGIRLSTTSNNIVMGNSVYNNDHGILLPYSAPGNHLNTIARNMIYSNDIGIGLENTTDNNFIGNSIFDNEYNVYMYSYSWGNKFINCSLANAKFYDFSLNFDSHAILLNTTFNKTRVYYGGPYSYMVVKWYMHVKVIYYNGSPVPYAMIWVNDTDGTNKIENPTDSKGWIRWIIVTEYREYIGVRHYFTPHYVTATDGNLWGYADPIMAISKVVVIKLDPLSHLLPPTNLTTKVVNNGNNVELEWDPVISQALDHYLIYRADSATEFDFTTILNSSTTWTDSKTTTWIDPDPNVTQVDDDFYYIVRAANFNESDISVTSNTAGVWTRTFLGGVSTFSLPLEPFEKKNTEFYCQDMNASYIKWMNHTTHTWMRHDKGISGNNAGVEPGEGYEIGFLGKSIQSKYTFTGMPGAMILYDNVPYGFNVTPGIGDAKNLTVTVDDYGNVTLIWAIPENTHENISYKIYRSGKRNGFWGTFGVDYEEIFVTNVNTPGAWIIFTDPVIALSGTEYYFMVVPINKITGERGVGSYSVGVWVEEYLLEYDTIGIPLKLKEYKTADWFCDNIPDTVGINYFGLSAQRWSWHSTRMPGGAFDRVLEMTEGYQISTSSATKFTFIGV